MMIRQPTPEDMPSLIEMGRAFNEEAGYAELVPFDADSFALNVATLARAGLALVADRGGGPIGMAALDIAPSICNGTVLFAREVFWYVLPAHRKGIGRELFNVLEKVAESRGVKFFDVIAEDGKRNDALAHFYKGRGYSTAEHTFRKVLRPCQLAA